jgi:hypothetical protein
MVPAVIVYIAGNYDSGDFLIIFVLMTAWVTRVRRVHGIVENQVARTASDDDVSSVCHVSYLLWEWMRFISSSSRISSSYQGKLSKNFPGNFPQYNSTAIFERDAAWAGFFTNCDGGRRLLVARN